ncbi:histidine phosphatase family protein [Oceaniglobus ichthyenteri]|uniref:histidine phosphatase family protein n=1 Tax=Oceaniglobus ichthyenteri TaxID=2136177 RepID=UPI000D3B34A6|nr:histidine phosphatase family protein [Oceaniglobus ichthyenteri]
MSAIWYWVRHGPTHEKTFVGHRDVPADLSDTAALARLSAYLPRDAVVVSSDLLRSVTTADAITDGRVRLPHAPELREFDFGLWDGLTFDAIAARDPELSRAYWETPGDIAPPHGESWNMAAARIAPFVDHMNREYSGQRVIAVAHIGVILTQIARAADLDPVQAIMQSIDNLSVTRIDYGVGADPINHCP